MWSPGQEQYFRPLAVGEAEARMGAPAPSDYFELFGLGEGCSAEDVKKAYRRLQKAVHPDVAGPEAAEMSSLLNGAAALMESDAFRRSYALARRRMEEAGTTGFDGRPVSEWGGEEGETRAVFVDETSCIGCMQCSTCASSTFFMEERHGRARVSMQYGDDQDYIEEAIEMCPVDCIYWVQRSQLALLEFVMKSCAREDIAMVRRRLSGNVGTAPSRENPFTRAENFLRARAEDFRAGGGAEGAAPSDASDDAQLAEHAAALSRAFLKLPEDVRAAAWPAFGSLEF